MLSANENKVLTIKNECANDISIDDHSFANKLDQKPVFSSQVFDSFHQTR